MKECSETQYNWINEKTDRLSKWLDKYVSMPFADNVARVLIIVLFMMIALAGLSLLGIENKYLNDIELVLKNIGPEMAGIVIGVVTIDYLNERRQREQLKQQLIRQMGLNIRDVAVTVARELDHHGWLKDGSVSGTNLMGADLSGADLREADLSGVILADANLSKANLYNADLREINLTNGDLRGANLAHANLRGSVLIGANLSQADLNDVNLTEADLLIANMSGSHLSKTNLEGASLSEAVLKDARRWTIVQLEQAKELAGAIMPDGKRLGVIITRRPKLLLDGPSLEEWKAQYLAENPGLETMERGIY